jgi:uncharacterized protein
MKLVPDSSAFAKRYVEEPGSQKMVSLLQDASELALCILVIPEILSALNRRLRENSLNRQQYHKLKARLISDVRDAGILQLTPAVISKSVLLLEQNTLRAMDALHIACAIEWHAELFVTADNNQWLAAKKHGLATEFIGIET